ncbi:MAG: LytR family transcriptional regulator, partial [Symbiobacteriaceae bacterium]|nr:LytR family transcriptional regulator [Symbiobacteriaceae bacterium]
MNRSRRRRGRRWLVWLAACIGVIVGLVGCVAFYRPFASNTAVVGLDGTPIPTVPPPPPLPVKRTTFLVMGVDKREDDSGRADTMILFSFDTEKQELAALSLPRDTWAAIPGHGYDKLNHSYAFGGEKLAKATVEQLVGIPIDHYVTVTFQDFAKIVDAVGGIDIDAEKRMYYEDPSDTSMGPDGLIIDIQAGPQHMDGITALKYSRFRMDEEGDLGRVRRQQQVVMALMRAAARPAILTKVPQLIPALSDAIDTDLSVAEMVKYGLAGKEAVGRSLRTGVFGGKPADVGGIFYFIPDLVSDRQKAYEILVGSQPATAFLDRARKDQLAYATAVDEANRQYLAAHAHDAEKEAESDATGEGAAEPGGAAPGSGQGPTDQQPKPGTAPEPKPTPAPDTNRTQQLLTVAVVDASGKNLSAEYVKKLKAAGF